MTYGCDMTITLRQRNDSKFACRHSPALQKC